MRANVQPAGHVLLNSMSASICYFMHKSNNKNRKMDISAVLLESQRPGRGPPRSAELTRSHEEVIGGVVPPGEKRISPDTPGFNSGAINHKPVVVAPRNEFVDVGANPLPIFSTPNSCPSCLRPRVVSRRIFAARKARAGWHPPQL